MALTPNSAALATLELDDTHEQRVAPRCGHDLAVPLGDGAASRAATFETIASVCGKWHVELKVGCYALFTGKCAY